MYLNRIWLVATQSVSGIFSVFMSWSFQVKQYVHLIFKMICEHILKWCLAFSHFSHVIFHVRDFSVLFSGSREKCILHFPLESMCFCDGTDSQRTCIYSLYIFSFNRNVHQEGVNTLESIDPMMQRIKKIFCSHNSLKNNMAFECFRFIVICSLKIYTYSHFVHCRSYVGNKSAINLLH